MDLENIALDLGAVDWVDNLPELGDLRVKVAAWENEKFNELQQQLMRAVPRGRRVNGRIKSKDMEAIHNRCIVATILCGWDNARLGGQPVPFSKETAERMIVTEHPKWKAMRDGIIFAAQKVASAVKEDEEGLLGNSGNTSGGETPGATPSS